MMRVTVASSSAHFTHPAAGFEGLHACLRGSALTGATFYKFKQIAMAGAAGTGRFWGYSPGVGEGAPAGGEAEGESQGAGAGAGDDELSGEGAGDDELSGAGAGDPQGAGKPA